MTEADLYRRAADKRAQCVLCPHLCDVGPGERGLCEARENIDGILYANSVGEVSLLEPHPIEALPLFHFAPGARALLVGSLGRSFPSELQPPQAPSGNEATHWASPGEIVDLAVGQDLDAIGAMGGDPFMWFEQWRAVTDAIKRERERAGGRPLLSIALTNGYACEEAARAMAERVDAVNLVLLGDEAVYRRYALDLGAVLRTARIFRDAGRHIEASFIALRERNLGREQVLRFGDLVAREIGPVALHVASPVDPETAAPVAAVHEVYETLSDRMPAVYLSPTYARAPQPTVCLCGQTLVARGPEGARVNVRDDGSCPSCGRRTPVRLR